MQSVLLVADHQPYDPALFPPLNFTTTSVRSPSRIRGLALALIPPLDSDDDDGGHVHSSGRIRRYALDASRTPPRLADRACDG